MSGGRRISPPDFVYGNTRLRARRGQHLAGPAPPAGDLAAASTLLRHRLRDIHRLYQAGAGEVVGTVLARYDLADVVTLLRGAIGRQPPQVVLPAVFAVHRVSDAAARDIAAAPEPAVAVQRLVEWKLPDPDTAPLLPGMWERYELHRDSAELERELAETVTRHWFCVLARYGTAADPVRAMLQREHDDLTLLAHQRSCPDGPGGLTQLEAEHQDGQASAAARGWAVGDPLGAAIPVAAVYDAQATARRLRRGALDGASSGAAGAGQEPAMAEPATGEPAMAEPAMAEPATGEPAMAELQVVVPPDRAAGYRLAGARVLLADTGADVQVLVEAAFAQYDGGGPGGVLAVHWQLWEQVPARARTAWQDRSVPLVVPLPEEGDDAAQARRDALRDLLARAVGYEITFATQEEE
jgi:vacuolar-type H+-ATPase subunit F/Vma7